MGDEELKFIYACPHCGQLYLIPEGWEERTCSIDGHQLSLVAIEHWDCNGEFVYEERPQ